MILDFRKAISLIDWCKIDEEIGTNLMGLTVFNIIVENGQADPQNWKPELFQAH